MRSSRWSALLVGLVVAATVAACSSGGGGGGGTGPTTPPPPPRSLGWTGAAEPGSQTVYLDIRDLSNPDEFVLQIRVSQVSDLYGVALDVVYPSERMEFLPDLIDEGEFFPAEGMFDVDLQIAESPPGRVIIGYSRLGDVSGRNGNGLLLLLTFRSTADGESDIRIESHLAIDSTGAPVPTTWLGGTVDVQR